HLRQEWNLSQKTAPRQLFQSVPKIALAHACHGRVNSYDQSREPRPRGAPECRLGRFTAAYEVQLIPKRARGSGHDIFQRISRSSGKNIYGARRPSGSSDARFAAEVNSSSAPPSIKSKTTLGTRLRASPRRSSILTARGGMILRDLFIQSSILATAISGFDLGSSKPEPGI